MVALANLKFIEKVFEMLKGFIGLFEAKDLFDKLKSDYKDFLANPNDPYKAYNFFVTAEHLPDWIDEKKIKYSDPYLRICCHLATGAKHFGVTHKDKNSVEGWSIDVYIKEGYIEDDYFAPILMVNLTDEEAEVLGRNSIELNEIASNVFSFWENHFKE